ncbi:phage tail protein [Listeria seeligeri]|uniref:phage tail protein n=1 Tax=Listeria seeligeri TaxID=1640 RepID=UPI0030D151D1
MDYLIIQSMDKQVEEVLTDVDYGSFSYDYEKNTTRAISFSLNKTKQNASVFDLLGNEAVIIYQEQQFVVKKCTPKAIGMTLSKQITAQHICYTVQDHVQYNVKPGRKKYSIQTVLEFALENNVLGFSHEVIGSFPLVELEDLGNKNGLELVNLCLEEYGAILFADNKKLYFYDEASWYVKTEKQFRYLYNTEDASVDINTDNLKTQIKCYGKQKENADKLTGDNKYLAVVTYTSPNEAIYGRRMANAKSDDKITNNTDLLNFAKKQILDVPETSLNITYKGTETVTERDVWYFIHEPMNFETEVKVTRIKSAHPWSREFQDVGFSNSRRDMVRIQTQIANQVKKASVDTNKLNSFSSIAMNAFDSRILTEVVGVVDGD